MLRRRATSVRAAAAPALALLVVGACTGSGDGDDAADDTEADVPVAVSVTIPPERQEPFCEAMIELSDTLVTDPPEDETALIIETYERVESEVPEEIAADFAIVLATLRGDPIPTTDVPVETEPSSPPSVPDGSTPAVDEFIVPPATPAERVNDYVEFACRDSLNNPGPPATAPGVELSSEDSADDTGG